MYNDNVCIIFALHCKESQTVLFLKTTLAWCLTCSLKWRNPFPDAMKKLCNSNLGFSLYDKVRNPGYGWLRYFVQDWQKNKKKKGKKKKIVSVVCFTQTQKANKVFYSETSSKRKSKRWYETEGLEVSTVIQIML